MISLLHLKTNKQTSKQQRYETTYFVPNLTCERRSEM